MKLHEILPGRLYQRGNLSRWSAERKLAELQAVGITVVASVWNRDDLDFRAGLTGIEYRHCPMVDNAPPEDMTQVNALVNWIVMALTAGKRALVYCNAGRNRSAFINALVVQRRLGLSGIAAVEYVKQQRPNAFGNDLLAEYVRRHRI